MSGFDVKFDKTFDLAKIVNFGFDPHIFDAKTDPFIVQLISAFVFATKIVKSLCFLNPNLQGSSHLLWFAWIGNSEYRLSHNAAQWNGDTRKGS